MIEIFVSEMILSYPKRRKGIQDRQDFGTGKSLKNIIVFAEINDIKVLVENIESDRDYLYLNKLDLYAVNRQGYI